MNKTKIIIITGIHQFPENVIEKLEKDFCVEIFSKNEFIHKNTISLKKSLSEKNSIQQKTYFNFVRYKNCLYRKSGKR